MDFTSILGDLVMGTGIMFLATLVISLIASYFEAFEYNRRKIAPLNGKEKFKVGDFILSNFIYFIGLALTHVICIVLFGASTMALITIVYAVLFSVSVDFVLLEKKVDRSELLIVPAIARLFTHLIAFTVLCVIWILL
jgi:hypothetical protein